MKRNFVSTCAFGAALTGVFALSGCGTASSSATTDLTGSLASTQAFSELANYVERNLNPVDRAVGLETAVAGLKCVTSANPPVTVTGTVASAGSFDIDLSSVQGQPLTCVLLDAQGNVLGTFVFADANASGLGGGSLQMDTVAFTGKHAVGLVTLSGGTITVDAVDADIPVTGATVTASSAFDPTGIWTITNPTFALPPGYSPICVPSVANNNCQNSNGPQSGMTLFVSRLVGKAFAADTACSDAVKANTFPGDDSVTCSGTTGSDDAFGLTIWNDQTAENNCGNGSTPALGATNNQAEAHAGIDFSGNAGLLTENLQYATSLNGDTIVNGWEDSTSATANFDMSSCQNALLSDGTTNAWKCYDANGAFSINIGGGCVDGSGNPVNVQQQLGMPITDSCQNANVTVAGLALQSNSCQFSFTPQGGSPETITCGGTFGAFNADGSAWNLTFTGNLTSSSAVISSITSTAGLLVGQQVNEMNGGNLTFGTITAVTTHTVTVSNTAIGSQTGATFNVNFMAKVFIAQGTLCSLGSTSTDAGKLAQEECYANYYYQNLQNAQTNACIRRIQTNWGATNSADFLQGDGGPQQAAAEQVLEKLIYFDDNHAAMTQVQDNYPGIAAAGSSNSFVPCHVIQVASIKITNLSGHAIPVTGDQMLVSFVQESHLANDALTNTVCTNAAATGDSNVTGTARLMFVMTRN